MLVLLLATLILIYWKAEWFATSLRSILLVLILVVAIGIALSVLGII